MSGSGGKLRTLAQQPMHLYLSNIAVLYCKSEINVSIPLLTVRLIYLVVPRLHYAITYPHIDPLLFFRSTNTHSSSSAADIASFYLNGNGAVPGEKYNFGGGVLIGY